MPLETPQDARKRLNQTGEGQAAWLGITPPQEGKVAAELRQEGLEMIREVSEQLRDLPGPQREIVNLLIDARMELDQDTPDYGKVSRLVDQAGRLVRPSQGKQTLRVQVVVTSPDGERHSLTMLLPDTLGRTPESVLQQIQDVFAPPLARQHVP